MQLEIYRNFDIKLFELKEMLRTVKNKYNFKLLNICFFELELAPSTRKNWLHTFHFDLMLSKRIVFEHFSNRDF